MCVRMSQTNVDEAVKKGNYGSGESAAGKKKKNQCWTKKTNVVIFSRSSHVWMSEGKINKVYYLWSQATADFHRES